MTATQKSVPRGPIIVLRLKGGVGNQLFQLTAGQRIAAKLNGHLILDGRLLPQVTQKRGKVYSYPPIFRNLPLGLTTFGGGESMTGHVLGKAMWFLLRKFGRLPGLSKLFLIVNDTSTLASPEYFPNLIFMDGYFQDLQLTTQEKSSIADLLDSSFSKANEFESLVEVTRVKKVLGVHWRQGDYLNDSMKKLYGELGEPYFLSAIRLATSRFKFEEIWVFSDSPIQRNTFDSGTVRIFDSESDLSPLESLRLLSHCSGMIGSNSTFSWWAASLGAPKSIVFMPASDPNARLSNMSEMYEPHWIVLPRIAK